MYAKLSADRLGKTELAHKESEGISNNQQEQSRYFLYNLAPSPVNVFLAYHSTGKGHG